MVDEQRTDVGSTKVAKSKEFIYVRRIKFITLNLLRISAQLTLDMPRKRQCSARRP